eukprot:Protomagalhaensia_wolfi_Nauph_80__3070@NODE_3140_length_878_cov_99_276520_g2462_i0_p1_GENE_NODE_3140_length_878_cov_99_276520_g2462_i0NODE_3140_length_878_cov_99_276520_g2462_i0_p1_ORF_typecomplete_len222_score27_78I_LWEQ/PF01608_17/0_0031CorA/PF01544_18/0_0096DUF4141/PF13605_6/49DUF4141/PF13605_6/2_6Tropomyosin_1/PF12718_7/0_052DUF948/PF06103_11/0_34eIF3_N/PF09440_10/0_082TBK1_CCD1/PF18394_1/0_073MCPsignal/PF00015_21/0_094SesA/PF17107_5/0_15ArAE_2_N/PF10337_9/0_89ArAE_2_N/PF10337_9/3_3Use1/PF09
MRRRREDVSRCAESATKVITEFTQGTLQSAKDILESAERLLENTNMTSSVLESAREIVASTQNILESTRGVLDTAATKSGRTQKKLTVLGKHATELARKVSDLEITRSTGLLTSSGNWSRSPSSPCSQCEPSDLGSGDFFTDFRQSRMEECEHKGGTTVADDPLPLLVEMARRAGALSMDDRMVQPVDLLRAHGFSPQMSPLAEGFLLGVQDFEAWFLANG